jgi:Dihydroorotate dehydrogenase
VQVCTAAMLDSAIGPNVIRNLLSGMNDFFEKHADKGWSRLEDIRGIRRDRIVAHSQIKRPEQLDYHGGYEEVEGYAQPASV